MGNPRGGQPCRPRLNVLQRFPMRTGFPSFCSHRNMYSSHHIVFGIGPGECYYRYRHSHFANTGLDSDAVAQEAKDNPDCNLRRCRFFRDTAGSVYAAVAPKGLEFIKLGTIGKIGSEISYHPLPGMNRIIGRYSRRPARHHHSAKLFDTVPP